MFLHLWFKSLHACMWLRDWVCARLCFYLFEWVIGSSCVFYLSRYWGEWQGVKLKLHPLSDPHNPHLCSSSAGFKIQIMCVFACILDSLGVCVCVCVLETVGVFSPSISRQYSFDMWQLQISHIMTAHRRLALQSHKLNMNPPPCFHPFVPFFFFSSFFFHIYLFISSWRG